MELTREQQLIILGLVLILVTGMGVMTYRRYFADSSAEIVVQQPEKSLKSAQVIVHITGAVRREGVYKLDTGVRLIDALGAAGGPIPNANLSALNLAEKVKDGQKIVVPVKTKVVIRGSGNPVSRGSGPIANKVSLNTASIQQLCKIKGVGKSMASKIVSGRPYQRIEDLMKVKGVGKGKFGKLKKFVCL